MTSSDAADLADWHAAWGGTRADAERFARTLPTLHRVDLAAELADVDTSMVQEEVPGSAEAAAVVKALERIASEALGECQRLELLAAKLATEAAPAAGASAAEPGASRRRYDTATCQWVDPSDDDDNEP